MVTSNNPSAMDFYLRNGFHPTATPAPTPTTQPSSNTKCSYKSIEIEARSGETYSESRNRRPGASEVIPGVGAGLAVSPSGAWTLIQLGSCD